MTVATGCFGRLRFVLQVSGQVVCPGPRQLSEQIVCRRLDGPALSTSYGKASYLVTAEFKYHHYSRPLVRHSTPELPFCWAHVLQPE